jgi:hypothetical protein
MHENPGVWTGNHGLHGGPPGVVPDSRQRPSGLLASDRLFASCLTVAGIVLFRMLELPAASVPPPGSTIAADGVRFERRNAEHRYRVVGKVRLLLAWVGGNDVGGARLTWRGSDSNQSIALLIGSDPQRAPRGVNEWGYIREDVSADSTEVFGIRTVTDGDSPEEAEARRVAQGKVVELGVLCSNVSSVDAASRTTTVHVAGDTTYRDVDRVLEVVERQPTWKGRRTARPADVAPGFLTAMDLMMRISAREAGEEPVCPRSSFVYKAAVYDLIPRSVERVATLRTQTGVYEHLLRTDIAVKNRATETTTEFSITYGTEGPLAAVPIVATYQPNWWFKVKLELDDAQDVPPDPAANASINQRIAQLCLRNVE